MSDDQLNRLLQNLDRREEPSPAFSDALFETLRAQVQATPTAAPSSAVRSLLAIAAVLVLAAGLAVGASVLLELPGQVGDPSEPAESGAPASPGESEPTGPSPSARSTSSELVPGAVVTTLVESLRLREAPGVDAAPLGTLAQSSTSFVVEGPVSADGYQWFLVTGMGIPPFSGCAGPIRTDPWECPTWHGWAASASTEGEAWLEPIVLDCPKPGPLNDAWVDADMQPMSLLACFGSEQITVVGWLPELPPEDGLGGACPEYAPASAWLCDLGYQRLTIDDSQDFFGGGLSVAVPVDGSEQFEALRGQWLEVRGHFDDPVSDGCPEGHERQRCRARFVLESATPTEGP